MKAKFKDKEVNVLALNKVALYGVELGLFEAITLNQTDIPQKGEIYLLCDSQAAKGSMQEDYRDLRAFAKEAGETIPPLSKIPHCEGAVNAKAVYHTYQEGGETWIEFEDVAALDRLYDVVNGEFIENTGPTWHE